MIIPRPKIKHKKKYCIYALFCPIKKVPYYVGCSLNVNKRYIDHCFGQETHVAQYTQLLRAKNHFPVLIVIEWAEDIGLARLLETFAIVYYRSNKIKLCNMVNHSLGNEKKVKQKPVRLDPIGKFTRKEIKTINKLLS